MSNSPIIPDWDDDVPEDDTAEPSDADALHDVSHWDIETAVNHDG